MNRSQPSLGRSLAIFNLASVMGLMFLYRQPETAAYHRVIAVWLRILSFPVGDLGGVLLSKTPRNSPMAIYGLLLTLGVNAFLWGHVLASILRRSYFARFIPPPPPPEEEEPIEPEQPLSDKFTPF